MTSATLAHFLLVEDDKDHADLILLSLSDHNVTNTIDHVRDGVEALQYLRREGEFAAARRPDVILLDLKLPRLDGHEVLEQIKSDDSLRSIPVVVLTTSANEKDRERAYALNANSYLTKPIEFSQFQRMIRDLRLYWSVWNQPPAPGEG
jgi:CheY-like chemotaxis protein